MSKYLPLGIPKPSMAKNIPNWFMDGWGGEQNVSEASDAQLVVKCKAGGVGSSAGVTFNAKPYNVFPRDYAAVQFDVYVEPKFEFVKGGKFGLGLTWGPEKASGGKWQAGSGSFRVMWRENGDVIGYLYLPLSVGGKDRDQCILCQPQQFKDACVGSLGAGNHGINLWHERKKTKPSTDFRLKKGVWNTIRLDVRLNRGTTPGLLAVTVNGVKREVTGCKLIPDKGPGLSGVCFATFYGGSTKDWAPPSDQTFKYQKFGIYTN